VENSHVPDNFVTVHDKPHNQNSGNLPDDLPERLVNCRTTHRQTPKPTGRPFEDLRVEWRQTHRQTTVRSLP
jgi:hypothetical protein